MCLSTEPSVSIDNCLLYNSPAVYETKEECIGAINSFMLSPGTALKIEAGYSPVRVDCYDGLEGLRGDRV